ncbi:MAG TPA: polysaccharide pyruvyl transferase family protein [Kineosporiaceae bacterium]|nr:polysaccharide pyruvyl transferase family protein [Kineosporiaceae bacterium]
MTPRESSRTGRAPRRSSRRPISSVALYGFLGNGNFGNDASFETVLSWLQAEQPDVEVRCITIAPDVMEARYGVVSLPLSWYQARPGTGRLVATAGKILGRVVDVPRSLFLAGSADAVIVPGMGVFEETLGVVPWGLPLWMFLLAGSSRLRRRPFILLDVGAEPTRNRLTRRLYVATAGLATHVSYRDEWSEQAMHRAGARAPDAVAPDLVFAHSASTHAEPEPGLVAVGVMAYYGIGDDPVGGAAVRRRYVATMAGAVGRLTQIGNRVVLLGGDRVDSEVAREVQAAVRAAQPQLPPEVVAVRDPTTFADVTDEMARAEVVVASRFHNLICALRLARPVVSVGYAEKNARLMEELGLGEYSQHIGDLDADWLVTQVRRAQAEGPAVTARLGGATRGYADQVRSLLRRLAGESLGLPQRGRRSGQATERTG